MPIIFEKAENNSRLAVWHITETEPELTKLINYDTPDLSKQLQQISHPSKRLEWLASRILLKQLGKCVPLVSYDNHGKPYLENQNICFSITHTNNFAAVVVSEKEMTGIDIEYPSTRISKLADRFVHPDEKAFIPHQKESLYHALLWCAKETIYKAVNNPGLEFKTKIRVKPFKAGQEGSFEAAVLTDSGWNKYHLNYLVTKHYYLVWNW
ncbi:4'-phosphopantetheinyl transferase family protein [Geofilum sp. OHC36d9]|uniref:4'-phosphopantetheinyl transferase family protein n=1 Tax=Geofilum sp. OHC36d9 TaxID=3458413 RepID=UPI004033AE45